MELALARRLPRCREGGLRGLSWIIAPGAVKAGGRYPNLAHVSDWLPTLTAAAGVDMATVGAGFEELDGVSHWAALTSSSSDGESVGGPPRTEILFNIVSSMLDLARVSLRSLSSVGVVGRMGSTARAPRRCVSGGTSCSARS